MSRKSTRTGATDIEPHDEYMWLNSNQPNDPLRRAMKDLEVTLRCPICSNLLDAYAIPVSIAPCQHTFCSECIRNSLRNSVQTTVKRVALCPVCRALVPDFAKVTRQSEVFRPNKCIEEVVRQFQLVRRPLCQALDHREVEEDFKVLEESLVEKSDNEENASVSKARRQPLASVHYGSLKRAQLRQLCAKYNLSTSGSEKELKERHMEFITLYNADCDATNPRSYAELAKEVEVRELSRQKELAVDRRNGTHVQLKHIERLKESRKAVGEGTSASISSGNESFDELMKNNFANMIAEVRKRKAVEKLKQQQEGDENVDDEDQKHSSYVTVSNAAVESSNTSSKGNNKEKEISVVQNENINISFDDRFDDRFDVFDHPTHACLQEDVVESVATDINAKVRSSPNLDRCNSTTLSPTSSSTPAVSTSSKQDNLNYPSFNQSLNSIRDPMKPKGSPSIVGPWTCNQCTFFNTKRTWTTASCEMCDTSRSVDTLRQGGSQSSKRLRSSNEISTIIIDN